VVYYTDVDTEQLWKYIPEFDDPTSTYGDFKDTIMDYYPEAAEFLYSSTDIDSLTEVFTLPHSFRPETLISARNAASVKSEPIFEITRNYSEHIPINSEQLLGITWI
jgi:hypothetical protein